LQITTEPLEQRQVRLTIVVPPERFEQAMREAAQHLARSIRIPGYRPGRVPTQRVIDQVGPEAVKVEAEERLRRQVVLEAIRSEGLIPSAPLTVDQVKEDPYTYRVIVPLTPEVDLGDYGALRIAPPEAEPVTDEDIDEVIEAWRRDLAFLAPVDRPAEEGDIMTLSLVGWHGENIVFDDDALNLRLNAEETHASNLPPEVVDALIGLSAGDRHAFEVTYSEFWQQPELQGQQVAFEAEVTSVSAITLPDLDDALAQEVSEVDTLADLRARVRQQLSSRAALAARDAHIGAALDALVEGAEVSYAPALLEAEMTDIMSDLRTRVEQQGFTWERWLELQQKDEDAFWSDLENQAKQRLRRGLVLSEFVRAEELDVAADEIEAEVKRLTDLFSPQAAKKLLRGDEIRRSTASRLLTSRALTHLLAITSGGSDGEGEDEADQPEDPGEST